MIHMIADVAKDNVDRAQPTVIWWPFVPYIFPYSQKQNMLISGVTRNAYDHCFSNTPNVSEQVQVFSESVILLFLLIIPSRVFETRTCVSQWESTSHDTIFRTTIVVCICKHTAVFNCCIAVVIHILHHLLHKNWKQTAEREHDTSFGHGG